MKKIASTWLDGQEVRKDQGGLGRVITGASIGSIIEKMVNTELSCPDGHVVKFGDAPDSGRCPVCKKAGQRARLSVKDPDNDGDMHPEERDARGVARAADDDED